MTTYGPFAETTPRGQTGWVDDRRRPVPEHLRLMLGKLDGTTLFTYSLWRGADPESIVVTQRGRGDAFIQAAGSAEALTVEVGLVGPDGRGRLYTVGTRDSAEGPTVLVPISPERAVRVSPNEVFTADEAADVFAEFWRTDAVAEIYTLRQRELSIPQSEPR